MSVRIMSLKLNRLLLYLLAAVLILVLLVILFTKLFDSNEVSAQTKYYPGMYTTSVPLGTGSITVEMVFSEEGIESVHYEIPDAVQNVYPLVQPTASTIGQQLENGIQIDAVQVDSSSSETASHLLDAMKLTVEKAMIP